VRLRRRDPFDDLVARQLMLFAEDEAEPAVEDERPVVAFVSP